MEKQPQDAVDLSGVHQRFFTLPVDGGKFRLIPHAAEGLSGKLHIKAGDVAVVVHIDIGRIGIAADEELGQRGVRLPRAAAAKRSHGYETC